MNTKVRGLLIEQAVELHRAFVQLQPMLAQQIRYERDLIRIVRVIAELDGGATPGEIQKVTREVQQIAEGDPS